MSKIYEALKKAEREKEGTALKKEVPQPSAEETPSRPREGDSSLSSAAAEEYRKMHDIIKAANSNHEVRSVLILSSVHSEGTSSVCSQFARSLVQSGQEKVLLVDANLRSPVLHDLFSLERKSGIVELLEGKVSGKEVVKETNFPGLFVITSGQPTEDPPHLLGSSRLKEALTEWERSYSYILFDSSPVLAYADAAILSRLIDGVVLVVQAGKTRWEVIRKAQDTLNNAQANFLGVVLNRRQYVIPKRVYKRL